MTEFALDLIWEDLTHFNQWQWILTMMQMFDKVSSINSIHVIRVFCFAMRITEGYKSLGDQLGISYKVLWISYLGTLYTSYPRFEGRHS